MRTALKARIEATFKDPSTGLYRSLETGSQTSLDGNLLAIDLGFLPKQGSEARELFARLVRHPLWRAPGGPGFTTFPEYTSDQKASAVKWVGISGYHDSLYWSWEMALAAKVARSLDPGDEALLIFDRLENAAKRDHFIGEVYEAGPGLELKRTLLYSSEGPFSWGAAFVIDALGDSVEDGC